MLKVAPELPPESLRMVLRPRAGAPAVKAGASAALLQWEVALVHPLLAEGSFAFALHEIGAAEERLVATLPTELPPTPVELDLSAQLGLARFEFPGKATNGGRPGAPSSVPPSSSVPYMSDPVPSCT